MKLLVRLESGDEARDLSLRFGRSATVGDVAGKLARYLGSERADLLTFRIRSSGHALHPDTPLPTSGLRSGEVISFESSVGAPLMTAVVQLLITDGPMAGRSLTIGPGAHLIGRSEDADVFLDDPQVSRQHAELHVGSRVVLRDLGSANGVIVNGQRVDGQTELTSDAEVSVGGTTFVVNRLDDDAASDDVSGTVRFNRPPRVLKEHAAEDIQLPQPPTEPSLTPMSWVTAMLPLMMGLVVFLTARNVASIIFFLFMPFMTLGMGWEQRRHQRRQYEAALVDYREEVTYQLGRLTRIHEEERAYLAKRYPTGREWQREVLGFSARLWERDCADPDDRMLRLGVGPRRATSQLKVQPGGPKEVRRMLETLPEQYSHLESAPVTWSLAAGGSIGLAGDQPMVEAVTRSVVAQLVSSQPPGELALAAVLADDEALWQWTKWLPHRHSAVSPLGGPQVVVGDDGPGLIQRVMVALSEPSPVALVVVIDGRVHLPPALVSELLQVVPGTQVSLVWMGQSVSRLPHPLGALMELLADGTGRFATLDDGVVTDVLPDDLTEAESDQLARRLAPVIDIAQRLGSDAGLPDRIGYHQLVGTFDAIDTPGFALARWSESSGQAALGAPVGETNEGQLVLDIRADGPHALIAGTTGAGKSEFLQTWVASLATFHSPARVTFLLVDYKGGAAFKDCVNLPHTIGLVTDLNTNEVRRALTSLAAEVTRREHLLAAAGARDLLDMERLCHPDTPPSLLIVVDEFAALAKEVPEFVDGVIDIAARGRSLGLHLVLATQRPAGVITDSIRANTGMRVALRVADEVDSDDVVGIKAAAHIDRRHPGRVLIKRGAGDLETMQTAYVGGRSSRQAPGEPLEVALLVVAGQSHQHVFDDAIGVGPADPDAPSDLQRMVGSLTEAVGMAGVPSPRRVWMPPLPAVIDAESLEQHSGTVFAPVIGMLDEPHLQRQGPALLELDSAGSAVVFGASGSGKTTVLRTLVAQVARSVEGARTVVYCLDFAGRGLEMLERLPLVGSVILGSDQDRVIRLLRRVREEVDSRQEAFARAGVGDLAGFRATGAELPRLLVLLDGTSTFIEQFEPIERGRWVDGMPRLVSEGRGVGVHFVLTAERRASMSSSLLSAIQRRVVLRLANDDEYMNLDLRSDVLNDESPPGRAVIEGLEVQVAVVGGSDDAALQVVALERLAGAVSHLPAAPPIGSLPDFVNLDELLGSGVTGAFALSDATLEPVAVPASASKLVILGPRRSGRTGALAAILASCRYEGPVHLLQARPGSFPGTATASTSVGEQAITEFLENAPEDGFAPGTVFAMDDLGDLDNFGEAAGLIEELVRGDVNGRYTFIATAEMNHARGASGPLPALLAYGDGLMLWPEPFDAEYFNVEPGAVRPMRRVPGRGVLVHDGHVETVQVGRR